MAKIDGYGQHFVLEEDIGSWKRGFFHVSELPQFVNFISSNGLRLCPTRRFVNMITQLCSEGISENRLYPYQQVGASFLRQNKIAFLFDEMGLGKTVQALCALSKERPAIVVSPAFLKGVWSNEAAKWRAEMETIVCMKKTEFHYPKESQVIICNYEMLPDDPDKHGKLLNGTALIADEAQYVKSWKAKRTRNFRKLARRSLKADGSVWLLSGTPILNRPNELWSLLQSVGLGTKLYSSYDRFVRLFGGSKDGLGVIRWNGVPKSTSIDPIRPYVLRRNRSEVLPQLPDKTHQEIILKLTARDVIRDLDRIAHREQDITEEALKKWKHAPEISALRKRLANLKLPTIERMVEDYERNGLPVVVFSAHREPVEVLGRRQGWAFIHGSVDHRERHRIVERFQLGELKGLACTIKSSGVGLTLTHSKHAIFVDLEWSPSVNLQAEDRLCRIGQDRAVLIQKILFDHPLDLHVSKVLDKKQKTIDESIGRITCSEKLPVEKLRQIASMLREG